MNRKNSKITLLIVGMVMLAAFAGGCSTPKTNTANSTTAKNTPDPIEAARQLYMSAPAGAQPPNMLGSPTSTVTVEEFADYQCPTCAVQHIKMKEITGLYGNRIKFVFRSFPLTQIHKNALEAAIAAEAAGMQGKFWAMQDQLFTNQKDWSNSAEARKIFEGYAEKIGLDLTKYQSDVVGLPAQKRVNDDLARGRAAGINGTPTIYLNGTKLLIEQMEVSALRQLIDAELQKTSNQPVSNPPANTAANAPTNTAMNATPNTANQSTVGNANTAANSK